MEYPVIHTNIWDAVIAVPVVLIMTQILKKVFRIPSLYVPTIAVILGLTFSVIISHRQYFLGGVFMGYFYGYAAIGTYSALKTSVLHFRRDSKHYS
ncbi:hypothetical protein [Bacillus massilinigeriensis]|uniref:hypothetical protein n=1 Tax=Bacillus mediterraneensis TaxID=1805474 RepID=UPI0008F8D29D|nr:hypothetical protein [Bacillus mediterraneensis]